MSKGKRPLIPYEERRPPVGEMRLLTCGEVRFLKRGGAEIPSTVFIRSEPDGSLRFVVGKKYRYPRPNEAARYPTAHVLDEIRSRRLEARLEQLWAVQAGQAYR